MTLFHPVYTPFTIQTAAKSWCSALPISSPVNPSSSAVMQSGPVAFLKTSKKVKQYYTKNSNSSFF